MYPYLLFLVQTAVYSLCEALGRPDEARAWANITGDIENQVLQCFLDGSPHNALSESHNVCSYHVDDSIAIFCYISGSFGKCGMREVSIHLVDSPVVSAVCLTAQNDTIKTTAGSNWLPRQLHLLARFGPQLFREEPSTFSVLLLHPQLLSATASDALSKWVEQTAIQDPTALGLLLPVLIPCVVNGALGDLHRCEALKLLERLLPGTTVKKVPSTRSGMSKRRHTS